MQRETLLPGRCIKSNQPADGRLKRKLVWHHPAIFLLALVSLLIYVIVALVLSKRATIHVGLSEECFARRRRAMAIGWGLVLLSIGAVVLGIYLVDANPPAGWLIAAGVLLFFVGLIYGMLGSRIVSPQRITSDYIWLKGVHADFLRDLPDWPYNP